MQQHKLREREREREREQEARFEDFFKVFLKL